MAKPLVVSDIPKWVEESFAWLAKKYEDEPIGAYVLVFSKTKKGTVASVKKAIFQATNIGQGITTGELIRALDDTSFGLRFEARMRVSKASNKK